MTSSHGNPHLPDETEFEQALNERVDQILNACVACGKCVEVCPMTESAQVDKNAGEEVAKGVLNILREGKGDNTSARRWAEACSLSGHCIPACDYGVNPRFMLSMARVALIKESNDVPERRRNGVRAFGGLSRNVRVLSRIQLPEDSLARLGQVRSDSEDGTAHESDGAEEQQSKPDILFYTGCNVLKTPHIALLALDIFDALGKSSKVVGGPTHCCGVLQHRAGDMQLSGRMGMSTIEKFLGIDAGEVVSWCPSCQRQFGEITLPTIEQATGETVFEMTPYLVYLERHLDELIPLLQEPVSKRVALLRHTGAEGNLQAAQNLLALVPGIEVIDANLPSAGLMSNFLAAQPEFHKNHIQSELEIAKAQRLDALVTIYHADHREICAHEADWPFEIINILEILGESMGLVHPDRYKQLKIQQDVEAIIADTADLITAHGLNPIDVQREVKAMVADQPLPRP